MSGLGVLRAGRTQTWPTIQSKVRENIPPIFISWYSKSPNTLYSHREPNLTPTKTLALNLTIISKPRVEFSPSFHLCSISWPSSRSRDCPMMPSLFWPLSQPWSEPSSHSHLCPQCYPFLFLILISNFVWTLNLAFALNVIPPEF